MKFFRNTIYTLIIAMTLLMVSYAQAAVSPHINFMGKVTNTNGTELADGTYDMTFSLYTTPTGGSSLWSESLTAANRFSGTIQNITQTSSGIIYTYSSGLATTTLRLGQYLVNETTGENALIIDYGLGSSTVTVASSSALWDIGEDINNLPFVEGGVINENLGSVSDLTGVDFNQTLYLEINFNGETMEPRKMLVSAPYAFESSRLNGRTGDEFAGLADDEAITGEWSFNNIVNISTTSSNIALTVRQNGFGDIVEFRNATNTVFKILNSGKIQFGDATTGYTFPSSRTGSSPGYVLKINASGSMYWDVDFAGSGGGSGLWASSSDGSFIYEADPGQILVIGNNSTSTSETGYQLEVTGGAWLERVAISDQNQLRFYDADSSNYVAIRASGTISSNFILTLPDSLGSSGEFLSTDSNGNLSWGLPPSGVVYANPGVAGQMGYYSSAGSTLSATSSIFLSAIGNFGIGTTSPEYLLTVGGTSGSQFLVNSNGQIVGGTWQGDILDPVYGGTGTTTASWTGLPFINSGIWSSTTTLSQVYGGTGFSSYTPGDIIYAGNDSRLARLPIDVNGKILTIVAGLPTWTSTSSLGMDISEISGILPVNQGGTGQNFTGVSGFLYFDSGTAIASSVLAISYTDLIANAPLSLAGNILSLDTSGDWSGTLDTHDGSYYLDAVNLTNFNIPFSTALFGTTTDALSEGLFNLYWTNERFDARLSATTSLPKITSLANLNTVGTITSGTWQGDILGVAYGGTGTSTFEANSIIYASAQNNISEILAGTNGLVLKMVGGVPTWDADLTVGGETGLWATSSDSLLISPSVSSYVVVIGASATTTTGYDLEVAGSALIGGTLAAQDLTISNPLGVASGGMGTSTFVANSLVFASSDNNIGQILPGDNGYALVMSGGVPTWSSTTPGIAHDLLSAQHSDVDETATLIRGDLLAVGNTGNWSRLSLGADGYILQSNGTDVVWATTTSITSLGTVNFGTWNAGIIEIAYGGTGAGTVAGARANLGLADVYKFGINATGTSGYIWQSDGDGRGQWVSTSSLGISTGGTKSRFIGTTTSSYYPDFTYVGGYTGYQAANEICTNEYGAGAHFCRTYDIIVSIELSDISWWDGAAWVAEGPPGYTANSNDCKGWTASSSAMLGAYWQFENNGGGMGWLISCLTSMPIACCVWQ